ncbi:hypothetical protein ENSA5_22540 [Enhygromyxa salina]|uniref:Uncharacterized protein n=1 Tax=Enhygromyxa salina TaxID=215803 RepID=A0A2S9YBM6_9BACT|nr:hypothetical protein ENSA5_22540 [Enhygromyxa salina]
MEFAGEPAKELCTVLQTHLGDHSREWLVP